MILVRCVVPVALLFSIAAMTAYGVSPTPFGESRVTVRDFDTLVEALLDVGATVEAAGAVSQPFFSVEGQVARINGGDVHVYQYESGAAATEAAALISPDGYTISTSSVMWVARPYFHRAGRLIVLYVGDEYVAVAAALEEVLGPPFAGGQLGLIEEAGCYPQTETREQTASTVVDFPKPI